MRPKGDVVDVSVMRTTVMETGKWVSGDLFNGRIVKIPNGAVLRGWFAIIRRDSVFIWDEIKIRLTYGSDHEHAREMLLRVANEPSATTSRKLKARGSGWLTTTESKTALGADRYP